MNTDNSTMELRPELAKKLFAEGAVLIIAGVPKATEFGIDLCSYTIGEKFRGVKMLPEGPHFVWCASQGPYGDSAPRVGFIHYFKAGEILVREWDHDTEELRARQVNDAELELQRIRENLLDLDRYLAPYDYRYVGEWKHLTDTITEEGVKRCQPSKGVIRSNAELQSCPDTERPRGKLPEGVMGIPAAVKATVDEEDLLPKLKPVEGTAPRFTSLPDRVPKNAEPSEVTRHSLDCLEAIDKLFTELSTPNDIIEEIQLAFVFYLIGHSVESLAHWRKLLKLLSHSEAAIEKYRLFYMKYTEVMAFQLPRLPEELMEPTQHNTVYNDVRELLLNLNMATLQKSAERLAKKLEKSLHWQFTGLLDEDPEDMPVIVETT